MQSDEGEINPVDILRWPGVMAAGEQDLDAIAAEILAALDGTWMTLSWPAKPKARR